MEHQSGWVYGDMPVHPCGGYSSIPQMGPSNFSGYVHQDFSNDDNFNATGYMHSGQQDFIYQSSSDLHYNVCPVPMVEPSVSIVIIPPSCPEPVPQYNVMGPSDYFQYVPPTAMPSSFPNHPTSRAPGSGMEPKKRDIVVVNLIDSDDDEPKTKSAKFDGGSSDAVRREDEIISFWEAEFIRTGAGRHTVFPDTFYLKDVQDMDQRPLAALTRLFQNTGVRHNLTFDYDLNVDQNVKQEVRCRCQHDQDWITGCGDTFVEAKNDAARNTLMMLLGSEKYEVINEMSKSARYEGLNRSRINEAVRRKSLIEKYRSYGRSKLQNALRKLTAGSSQSTKESIMGGKSRNDDDIVEEIVQKTEARVEVVELCSQASRNLKRVRYKQNKKARETKSANAAAGSNDKSNLVHIEVPPENVDDKSNLSHQKETPENLDGKSNLSHPNVPPKNADDQSNSSHPNVPPKNADDQSNLNHPKVPPKNVDDKAQKIPSPPEGALNDTKLEEIHVVNPADSVPSTQNGPCPSPSDTNASSLRMIVDECNSRVRRENQSRCRETDSLLGGSGTDLSEDEVENSTSSNQMSSSIPTKRLENEFIKFWLDRKPYTHGLSHGLSREIPSVYNLCKMRNIKEKPKRAVDALFANMTRRPKYKITMDGGDFCVNWSWADVDVTGRGPTLTDAEDDASSKFLVKFLGEDEFNRICQMCEEYEVLNSNRVMSKLGARQGYTNTVSFLSSREKRQYDTSFDFQVLKLPKTLTSIMQPLSIDDLKSSVPKISSKLRAFSVKNRSNDKICSVDKLAPFQNFERVEQIAELENNAVAALGSLFASEIEEPFPVYTCVPYANPISFKVECSVWGKYFVAEASSEESAKNLAAQSALKFLMGNERYEEQVMKN